MILAKWRQVNMFQYTCLNPLILPEGICIWILIIHPSYNTYFIILTFSPGEFFKPLQYQSDKLASCYVAKEFYENSKK